MVYSKHGKGKGKVRRASALHTEGITPRQYVDQEAEEAARKKTSIGAVKKWRGGN